MLTLGSQVGVCRLHGSYPETGFSETIDRGNPFHAQRDWCLPLLLRRLGMDPAIMSNPLISAMVDILGVVIFYEIATLFLS